MRKSMVSLLHNLMAPERLLLVCICLTRQAPSQDDAQIGVDVLGWRQTIAGVGHCRQVGCPESGIDDAVQRLASLGYKVHHAAPLCLPSLLQMQGITALAGMQA